jgi:methyl-accepting chemotaxis protein
MRFIKLRITTRIHLITAAAAAGMTAIAVVALLTLSGRMMEDRIMATRNVVDSGYSVVAHFEAQERAGRLTREAAQQAAIAVLRAVRYGENDYIFISDYNNRLLMQPIKPELEGQDGRQIRDPNGTAPVEIAVKVARSTGKGSFSYLWPKPGASEPVEKVTYARGFEPWGWALASGIYVDDVRTELRRSALHMAGQILVVALLVIGLASLIARRIVKPVQSLTRTMTDLAVGNLAVAVPGTERADEVGEMAKAVEVFKQHGIEKRDLEAEQREEQARKEARQQRIEEYIAAFDDSVRGSLETLASAATEMRASSETMSGTAAQTSEQATAVTAAAEQASMNVQTIGVAAEQLAASIAEINRQMDHSAAIAGKAVQEAVRTNETVEGLSSAAQKISEVVQLIQDIASQTNLLALNATIESARAGAAGKGFAVVANEVKSLASQTARATEDISSQIAAIQTATQSVVEAIRGIGGTIAEINEISTTIASAVQEQGASTQEIARNTQEVANGTREVTANIAGVSQNAGETGTAATQLLSSATDLGRQAEGLRAEVDHFLARIRAA